MIDENSSPSDVAFTGEAPSTYTPSPEATKADGPVFDSPPEVPNPHHVFYVEAMRTFNLYCLHMFEQFQEDIFALQRRVQVNAALIDAYNQIIPSIIDKLKNQSMTNDAVIDTITKLQKQVDEQDESLVDLYERQSKAFVWPNGGVPVYPQPRADTPFELVVNTSSPGHP